MTDNPVLFLAYLLVAPVLLVGLIECGARVWVWCRHHEGWNKSCTSACVSGFVALLLLAILSEGWPQVLNSLSDVVRVATWCLVGYLGIMRFWAHRRLIKGLLRRRFNPNRAK